jgi:hypothetical protein
MALILLAGTVAAITFVAIVLATVLADLLYVRNRVPLTVVVAPALLAVATDARVLALGWLALTAIVTAQRDPEENRFALSTSVLLFGTVAVSWLWPEARMAYPLVLLVAVGGVMAAIPWLRRVEIEPVPWRDQVTVVLCVLLVATTDAVR